MNLRESQLELAIWGRQLIRRNFNIPVIVRNRSCSHPITLSPRTRYLYMGLDPFATDYVAARILQCMEAKRAVGHRGYGSSDVTRVSVYDFDPIAVRDAYTRSDRVHIVMDVMSLSQSKGLALRASLDPRVDIFDALYSCGVDLNTYEAEVQQSFRDAAAVIGILMDKGCSLEVSIITPNDIGEVYEWQSRFTVLN